MNLISFRLRAAASIAGLAFFAGAIAQTSAATLVGVGNCVNNVPEYFSIQKAINAVPPGSTVEVCPGIYKEQVSITKSLTLKGVPNVYHQNAVVITSPVGGMVANTTSLFSGAPIAANIVVDGASAVTIGNLTVDSSGNNFSGCGAPELIGIFYRNSSGTLNHIVTRNQWVGASETDTTSNGCQNGLGIFAQSGGGGSSVLTVTNSSVHDYQKNGITGNEAGTTLNVNNTDVVGQGPTNGAAENGIQIGFGATGNVNTNLVINDIWAPDTISDPSDAAAGILLYDAAPGAVTVSTNTVGNTQFGIALVTDTSGLDDGESVLSNKVFDTLIFDAIDVCSNGNSIKSNIITNSSESAIHLDASCGALDGGTSGDNNTVTGDIVIEAGVGLLKDAGVSGNTVNTNSFFDSVVNDPPGNVRAKSPNTPVRP